MDFPMVLSNYGDLSFKYGGDELRQCIYLLLKENYGGFLQSAVLGSRVAVHSTDADLVCYGVRVTVEQLRGLKVESVSMAEDMETIYLRVQYMGRMADFEFSVSSF